MTSDMTLSDLLEQYLKFNRRIRSERTVLQYRLAIKHLGEAIGDNQPTARSLTDENLVRLEQFLHARKCSAFTINGRTACIKAMWTWAAKKRYVDLFPTMQRVPVPQPYRRAWTADDVTKLFASAVRQPGKCGGIPACQWWAAFLRVQYETGERTGAMLQLRWEWLRAGVLDVPGTARKCGKRAIYKLSGKCLVALNRTGQPNRELIFPCSKTRTVFYRHFKEIVQRAGLPYVPRHDAPQKMRRTHLTFWAIGGEDATKRAKHSSPHVTAKHYLDESLMPQRNPGEVLPFIPSPSLPSASVDLRPFKKGRRGRFPKSHRCERAIIEDALERNCEHRTATARELGVNPSTLYRWMKTYGMLE